MKKEENHKINQAKDSLRNVQDCRPRSHSPKAYLGCDTCKLKNNELKKVKSVSKFSDSGNFMDKNKLKKPFLERERYTEKSKIKLTDLCDEDKKRIVELIEELSKFAEKNQKLKESLDRMHKIRQEQQDYIMKQANLHLEEKNFYVNEINEYKNKIELAENEMKNKSSQWENRERYLDTQIACLGKTLQKLLKEKNDLHDHMNHLKVCLKQSLESFQTLRTEVSELQRHNQTVKKFKVKKIQVSCQTEGNSESFRDKYKVSDEDTEEEEFSATSNHDNVLTKSNLDILNDKLEHVYQLLKRKSESLTKRGSRKLDIDLSILLKNQKLVRESENEMDLPLEYQGVLSKESSRDEATESGYKFLKPFDQCSKTSMQAERILKKMERPLNLDGSSKLNNKLNNFESTESSKANVITSNILHTKVVQKNNLFKSSEECQYDEDRLLEELFYSDQSINFGWEPILRLESLEEDKTLFDPFT